MKNEMQSSVVFRVPDFATPSSLLKRWSVHWRNGAQSE